MGAWGRLGCAAVCAAVFAAPARSEASTVWEPIARLSLEGGYDSNVLYDGRSSDRMARISPEAGLRLRDHLWDARASYRGDWIAYERLAAEGSWNHHAALMLDARPTRRLELRGAVRGSRAEDPVGLAQAGVFRTGRQSAFLLSGRARGEYRWSRRVDVAATLTERMVLFEDRTGGALHAPGAEALWRATRRLSVGGAYGVGFFQGFARDRDELSFSHSLKARARWRASRRIAVEASAGPALWIGDDRETAVVPEASVDVLGASRFWDLRLSAAHGLGIGTTARPGLVNSLEAAAERRFGRRWLVRGDGGLWHSGEAPSGRDSTIGYAVTGEAGVLVGMNVRLSLAATHFARLDDTSAELRRTTMGLRVAWELPTR